MRYTRLLWEKVNESMASVLPITGIVLILSITVAPLSPGTLVLFLFGAIMLVFGMGLFTLGVDMSMIPMGEGVGVQMSHSKRIWLPLAACFVLGAIITMAEPDLQVLAEQVAAIPNQTLILTVAVGVGIFLLIAELRMVLRIPLSYTLLFFYAIVFILAYIAPDSIIAVAFDSGGVTTGPVTVPFIMALGIGMASVRSDKNSSSDSFGLIALCSIGPILSVLFLGTIFDIDSVIVEPSELLEIDTTAEAAIAFLEAIPEYALDVLTAIAPIAGLFLIFQIATRRFGFHQILRIVAGLIYTYLGLVFFLTGVNVGFSPAGQLIGTSLAESATPWLLIPVGMIMGWFIVKAEPAVQVLTRQVEEVSNGSISHRSMGMALSIGIAVSVGLAMVRILTGISILWFLVPGYVISLLLTFFVPQIYTGIAFDSGGVASGPMTATFLLPMAMGACEALGGNVMTDAFGIVAMVAMTPLVTIQLLGVYSKIKESKPLARLLPERTPEAVEDVIWYYDV